MDFIWKNKLNQESELLTHVLYYHYNTMEYDMIKSYFLNPSDPRFDLFLKDYN